MSKRLIMTLLIIVASVSLVEAQQTAFSYQGKLTDNGAPANGNYDLQFDLWSAITNGNQVSPRKTVANVPVNGGVFTVTVDFGPGISHHGLKET